ncbi:hypothetical protein Lpp124_07192, partial [Lacticaseibacillus paracasei subsp. paracasei CNCM I-4649]
TQVLTNALQLLGVGAPEEM